MATKKAPVTPVGQAADKKKALETALSQIEKDYGKGAIMRLGEDIPVNVEAIPTGSLGLDIALGIGGSANFTTSLPTAIFGRQGFAKVNSVVFPIQGAVTAMQFLINAIVQKATGGQIRYAYLVFMVVALINVILVTRVDDHRYNRDYHVQNGNTQRLAEIEAELGK